LPPVGPYKPIQSFMRTTVGTYDMKLHCSVSNSEHVCFFGHNSEFYIFPACPLYVCIYIHMFSVQNPHLQSELTNPPHPRRKLRKAVRESRYFIGQFLSYVPTLHKTCTESVRTDIIQTHMTPRNTYTNQ